MRKTEQQYAWLLTKERQQGKIIAFRFEEVTFYLTEPQRGTKRVSYTPDFFVVLPDGKIRIDEIKGPFIREDSELKFKVAADKFPWLHWRMIQIGKKGVQVIRESMRKLPQDARGEKMSVAEVLGPKGGKEK